MPNRRGRCKDHRIGLASRALTRGVSAPLEAPSKDISSEGKSMPDSAAEQFAHRLQRVRNLLQIVEDELLDMGYADIAVTTENGAFDWRRGAHEHQAEQRAVRSQKGPLLA
ncbi:MAG TPA: hypothetical protein VKV77_06950 [Methylovirgula sp.]|nr:hypothetical protein [Methylovirgula sp.]